MKAPKLKRDWRGWRVRLLCEVSTRMATLPAGFEMTVVGTLIPSVSEPDAGAPSVITDDARLR